jgi:hypothetical protein
LSWQSIAEAGQAPFMLADELWFELAVPVAGKGQVQQPFIGQYLLALLPLR